MTREAFTEVAMDSAKETSKLLAQVVLITREMLECAQDQEWAKVTYLEEERRNLLASCFANSFPEGQSHLVSEALAAMLQMNEEMIGLLEAAKENVAIKRTDQSHKKRSLGHYLDIEKSH